MLIHIIMYFFFLTPFFFSIYFLFRSNINKTIFTFKKLFVQQEKRHMFIFPTQTVHLSTIGTLYFLAFLQCNVFPCFSVSLRLLILTKTIYCFYLLLLGGFCSTIFYLLRSLPTTPVLSQANYLEFLFAFFPLIYFLLITSTSFFLLFLLLEMCSLYIIVGVYLMRINITLKRSLYISRTISMHNFMLLFFQILFNFYGSIIFFGWCVLLIYIFGLNSHLVLPIFWTTYQTAYLSGLLQTYDRLIEVLNYLLIIFFVIKFGLGPWFQYKIYLYRYFNTTALIGFIFMYYLIFLPIGFTLILYFFIISTPLIFSSLLILGGGVLSICYLGSRYITINTTLGASSVLFFSTWLLQLLVLFVE